MEQSRILTRLLAKYEKSKHMLAPGESNRRVMLQIEKKELPEYQYQNAAIRDAFNRAARELEREQLIRTEWVKDRPVLSALILNLDQVDRCYQAVGKIHPREQAAKFSQEVEAALLPVQTAWIAAWRDEVCARARYAYGIPSCCKKNAALLPNLLTALVQFDALHGEPVTMRAFSSRCYHDSKFFEREIRDIFMDIAQKYCPDLAELCEQEQLGVRDKLAYLGIYARPELYELSGCCILETGAGNIDVGAAYPYGIALPSTAVDAVTAIDLRHIRKVVFIENKTNYDEYLLSELDMDTLAVYHGGFLSPQKRKLFRKISDAIPQAAQVYFWADIDLGGFQMFSHLQKLIPKLTPMRMTGSDVIAYQQEGLRRDEEYLDRLKSVLEANAYPLFTSAIQEILQYGVTIEQEAFLADL